MPLQVRLNHSIPEILEIDSMKILLLLDIFYGYVFIHQICCDVVRPRLGRSFIRSLQNLLRDYLHYMAFAKKNLVVSSYGYLRGSASCLIGASINIWELTLMQDLLAGNSQAAGLRSKDSLAWRQLPACSYTLVCLPTHRQCRFR